MNTHFDLASGGGEMLASPESLRAWLGERGLLERARRVDGRGLDRVLAVREGLRALAFANNEQELNDGAVAGWSGPARLSAIASSIDRRVSGESSRAPAPSHASS